MPLLYTIPPGRGCKGADVYLGTRQRVYHSVVDVVVRGDREILTHGKPTLAPGLIFGQYRPDLGAVGPISWASLN